MSNEIVKAPPTIGQCLQSQKWEVEVKKVLPQYLTPELMLRVARTVATDPKFAQCTPESFLAALLKCGRAGLVPDGRNAHLIPFGKEVQAIFDWKGMVAMAGRNGVQVTAKLVHRNDVFRVQEDDGSGCTKVVHEVDFRQPRGEILAVYSRAKTVKSDEVDYEFMTADEVEFVRQTFSRAKDSLMWTKSWGEGAKKTVIRRHSKRWDLSPEDRAALMDDDDTPDFTAPQVVVSKPIFETKQVENGTKDPNGETDEPHAETKQPEPETQPESVGNGKPNYLKGVRNLCNIARVTEGELLGFLSQVGRTDGSAASLEDLALTDGEALRLVYDNWSGEKGISTQIIAARKVSK